MTAKPDFGRWTLVFTVCNLPPVGTVFLSNGSEPTVWAHPRRTTLKEEDVGASVHYPHPLPRLRYYREKYGYDAARYPNATAISDRSLNLPVAPHIDDAAIDRIGDVFNRLVGNLRE